MEVRILNTSDGETKKKVDSQIQEKVDPRFGEDQLSIHKVKQMEQDFPNDVHSDTGSCVTSEEHCQNSIEEDDEGSSLTVKQTIFSFSSNTRMKTSGSTSSPIMRNKRRKMLDNKKDPPTNFCGCRYTTGQKRKAVYQHIAFEQRLKKQFLLDSLCNIESSCNVSKSCVSLVNYCANDRLQVQGSLQQLAEGPLVSDRARL